MHFPSPFCSFGERGLGNFITSNVNTAFLRKAISHLRLRFEIYSTTCPTPFIAPGLMVTREIRNQSEIYLPIVEVTSAFNHLYRSALLYPPIYSSSPFHNAMSWADVFAALPRRFQSSADPACLLETLLADRERLTDFLFASFLPNRFYGGFQRYTAQQEFVRNWLAGRNVETIRCLDAACGTGEDTYGLLGLLMRQGFEPENIHLEGWTLEPLEVWAATERRFPHDPARESLFREATSRVLAREYLDCISFRCIDLIKEETLSGVQFDLIICNGLLGGPIITSRQAIGIVVQHLVRQLAADGILLAADHFHGGWKRHCPQHELQAVFVLNGLSLIDAGEGIVGLKPYQ